MRPPPRLWAEISAKALAYNIALLRQNYGPARIMAVVKANAYGHDTSLVAPHCAELGVRDFGIATPMEGIALRALLPADAHIYLLGPAFPEEAPAIVYHRLTPLVSSPETAQALSQAAVELGVIADVHLDLDTGIGRAGVQIADAPTFLSLLDRLPGLRLTGLATHFVNADDDPADAATQYQLFMQFLQTLGPRAKALLIHASNSPAALHLPLEARHGMIRPGLLLYGIEPTQNIFTERDAHYQPILSLKTRVTLCRFLPGGANISYGRAYTVPPGGGTYATLGVGYGDGYQRRFSNSGFVLIHGRRAPICGRVCMDQIVVDVSQIPGVQAGDIATLIGTDGEETLTASSLAAALRTTPHEITTSLTARVPRVLSKSAEASLIHQGDG